jgi:hypothetical protein
LFLCPRGRGSALLDASNTGLALLVAALYGRETRGARLGLLRLVAAMVGAALIPVPAEGQLLGLQLPARLAGVFESP